MTTHARQRLGTVFAIVVCALVISGVRDGWLQRAFNGVFSPGSPESALSALTETAQQMGDQATAKVVIWHVNSGRWGEADREIQDATPETQKAYRDYRRSCLYWKQTGITPQTPMSGGAGVQGLSAPTRQW